MDADAAIATIIGQQQLDGAAARLGHGKLLPRHQCAAIAQRTDHLAPGETQRRRHSAGHAAAHGAGLAGQQQLARLPGHLAIERGRKGAGIERHDGIGRRHTADKPGDLAKCQPVRPVAPLHTTIGDMQRAQPPVPGRAAGRRRGRGRKRRQQGRRIRIQGENRREVPAQPADVAADMHQRLPRRRPGVTLAGDVMQPGAQGQDQVRLGERLTLRCRIAQPHVAGIKRVGVGEQ